MGGGGKPKKKGKEKAAAAPPPEDPNAAQARVLLTQTELRVKMEQEAQNSRINRKKIQNQWRKIMRLAKVEALKREIEILSQNHERDVDRKDAIIQMLDRDLEEAEDQFQMALRAHLQNMDTLIDVQDARLLGLEQEFKSELQALRSEFTSEKDRFMKQHRQEVQELHAIIEAIEQEELERETEARQSHEQLREEIRNRNLEEINMLRIALDGHIEELEQHFETAHLNYLQQTNQRTHDFKELTKSDQKLSKDIEVKRRKIDRLQTSIHHWRTKMRQLQRENDERNRLLQDERNAIQRHYQQLKRRIQQYRKSESKHLLALSQNTNACRTSLQARLDLAARIMQVAELSRKLETEQEKVLPFQAGEAAEDLKKQADDAVAELGMSAPEGEATANPAAAAEGGVALETAGEADAGGEEKTATGTAKSTAGGTADDEPNPLQTSVWAHNGRAVPKFEQLGNFYRKYNKVLLDKLVIEREEARLEEENNQLQGILQQYLDGLSVNDSVLASDNPLVVVNGRANLNRPPVPVQRASGLTPVQEATHLVSTSRVSTKMPL